MIFEKSWTIIKSLYKKKKCIAFETIRSSVDRRRRNERGDAVCTPVIFSESYFGVTWGLRGFCTGLLALYSAYLLSTPALVLRNSPSPIKPPKLFTRSLR